MVSVLFVSPTLNRAGAQKHVLDVCKRLNESKYKVSVCVLGSNRGPLVFEFEEIGIRVDLIKYRGWWDIGASRRLYKYLRGRRVDIFHIHDIPSQSLWAIIIAKIAGVPFVVSSLHGLWKFYSWKGLVFKSIFKITDKFCDKYIAVSETTKAFWISNYGISCSKIKVIPNGVDLTAFEVEPDVKERPILGFPADIPVVGTVGSLTPIKGYHFLLKAIPRVLKSFPTAQFVFVGDGELREDLEKLGKNLGVSNNVIFLGSRDDVPELLKEFDLFVLPSAFEKGQRVGETFGIAIVEAMATGKAVVATEFSGIPEVVVNGETGILVPPSDPESLAEAIVSLLADKDWRLSLGLAGRKRVEEKFSIEFTVDQIDGLYQQLLQEKARAFRCNNK